MVFRETGTTWNGSDTVESQRAGVSYPAWKNIHEFDLRELGN